METSTTDNNKVLHDVLEDNSTKKFFMEYHGFLSNHLAHGIIALHRLGADRERLDRFVDWYKTRLESPDGDTAQKQDPVSDCSMEQLRGARKGFYTIFQYYHNKLEKDCNGDIGQLVREEFPKLSKGLTASLLHGLIHLGYGCAAKSPRLVCEGLAYLHHSYLPICLSREHPDVKMVGKGNVDIGNVLDDLRNNSKIHEYMVAEVKTEKLKNWNSPPQRRLSALLTAEGDYFMDMTMKIKGVNTGAPNKSMEDALTVAKWVIDAAVLAYTKAEYKNDFVLLHGVTAAWSLMEIVKLLQDPQQAFEAITTYLCVLLATFVTQDSPKLELDTPEKLQYDDWSGIISEAVSRDCDEHVYKLVQVVHELQCEFGDSNSMYKEAANEALATELTFIKY